jgi:hypothetical protein
MTMLRDSEDQWTYKGERKKKGKGKGKKKRAREKRDEGKVTFIDVTRYAV